MAPLGVVPEASPASPAFRWVVVGVIWMIALLNYADRMTIFSVFPILKQEMHIPDVKLGLLGSTFLWAYAISSPFGGFLGDRFSRRRIVLVSLLIFSAVTFATGLARSASQLLVLRCLLGFAEAVFLPPALAYIAGLHTDRTRSLANSIALTGLTAGTGVGSWYGGYMSEHFSWRVGFFGLGVAGLVVAILARLVLRDDCRPAPDLPAASAEPMPTKAREVLRTRTARALIFLAFALSLSSWPLHSWLPTYLYEQFHLSLTAAGSAISFYAAIPALAGSLAGGLLADRWSRQNAHGRLFVQVIALAAMSPALLVLAIMDSPRQIAVDLSVYSVFRGMLECNSMPIFCSVVPPHRWSMAYGLYNFAGTLAGSLGIFFVGFVKNRWSIAETLSSMSVLLFVSTVVLWFTSRGAFETDRLQEPKMSAA